MATAVLRRIIADVDQSRPDLCRSKVHRRSVDDDGRFLVVADRGRRGMSFLPRRVLFVWIGRRWGVKEGGGGRGPMPPCSGAPGGEGGWGYSQEPPFAGAPPRRD